MKKNLWFKLGLFCTALVLVATCFISTAWAKYTKTTTLADTARVAKFEVKYANSEVSEAQAFQNVTLDLFDTKFDEIKKNDAGKNIVSEKLIAPGSYGKTSIEVLNSGEVDVKITLADNKTVTNNIPVKFVFSTSNTAPTSNDNYKDLASALNSFAETLKTGDNLNIYIFWKWVSTDDEADTDLGVLGTAKYKLKLNLTAEQVLPGTTTNTGN